MKLVRFGEPGKERPGLVDQHGHIRDLSGHVTDDIASDTLPPATLRRLAAIDIASLPLASTDSTGTPPGVGMGQKPEPVYLRAGQTMRLGIAGLGEQRQRTVDARIEEEAR